MPINTIAAPIRTCKRCQHSKALCTCNTVTPISAISCESKIDWEEKIRLDREEERRKLEARRHYDAQQTKLLMEGKRLENDMPIKTVTSDQLPGRMFAESGKMMKIKEVAELMEILRDKKRNTESFKGGGGLEVVIPESVINGMVTTKTIKGEDGEKDKTITTNPIKQIVNAVRRKLSDATTDKGDPIYDVYASSKYAFVVVKEKTK